MAEDFGRNIWQRQILVIEKLRIITLIEGDLQLIMRIYLGGEEKEKIEDNNHV